MSRNGDGMSPLENIAAMSMEAQRRANEIAVADSARRDAREAETLAIAKEANAIARSEAASAWLAARYAMYAAITAVLALAYSAKESILTLIFGSP